MAGNKEKLSFREKPRKRKSIIGEAIKELQTKEKPPVVKQTRVKPKRFSKVIGVRFNEEEYKQLLLLQELKEYSTPSITIKEAIRFAIAYQSWLKEKAEELRRERKRFGIPLKWLE